MASPVVLDASPEHVAYALLGCFIIVFGLVSLFVKEKMFISEAFVSTAFGIIIGPYALGIFDPMSWENYDTVTLEFTRIVIAVQVMAAGVSLPRSYMVQEKRSLFMMIVPLMVLMWLTSAALIWGLIPDLDFVECMILAACVTPTDPVLSNSVVKGRFAEKYVPPRIRYLLSAESGINDGMGIPFLYLGLFLLRERTVGGAVAKWVYMIWIYQILLSVVLGGLVGAAARKLVKGAKNRNLIDKESFLVFSIALALAVSGCVSILASDDLLAVFIAGNVFAWDDWFSNEIAEAHIQEIIDMLLNLACFVYIGASIPFSMFHDLMLELSVWRLIVLAIVILIFRRMPFVVAMKGLIPALSTYREAAFAGWFGPIGVGAVYLSKVTASMTEAQNLGDNPYNIDRLIRVRSVIFPIVMFLVFSSVLVHGITVPLLHLQYKYTRTWSRKREESSHVVTRLPHINIGDDIVLRPAVGGGSASMLELGAGGGDLEQRMMGYDSPRFDQMRPSQRGFDYGNNSSSKLNMLGYSGKYMGLPLVQDLSRTSTGNTNTRTLEDVVQEMKEAKSALSPSLTNSGDSGGGGGGVHPLTMVSVHSPDSKGGQHPSQVSGAGMGIQRTVPLNKNYDSGSPEAIESLRESHPASQGLNIHPSNVRVDSPSGCSENSSTTLSPASQEEYQRNDTHPSQQQQHRASSSSAPSSQSPSPPSSFAPPPRHRQLSASEFQEVEREEDNGRVRIARHDVNERDRPRLQSALEEIAHQSVEAPERGQNRDPEPNRNT
ncbi:Sodium/hydrogen exchanger family-domain-containing protein [Mortierella sp. GBAus27b]|nr:hypothetical protein BGX31_008874 [Mortierella sp. GBA43]KAI8352777.1 Sodium/hydrogen exchanger family-domain-containing protein [Mortierella sp. GBAus27b]